MSHNSRNNARPAKAQARALEVGYWVALVLTPDSAPMRCYAGEVQAVDAQGVRLTLVDWLTGTADSFDLFVPWSHIAAALIATPEHDRTYFLQQAVVWQERMGEGAPKEAERGLGPHPAK